MHLFKDGDCLAKEAIITEASIKMKKGKDNLLLIVTKIRN
jgi:hypothetical protein